MGNKPAASVLLQERDPSIDYLRALVTALVLVIHCSAPYAGISGGIRQTAWQSAVPIIDAAHSSWLAYLLCFLDVSTMSLMFFISGLFLYPSLQRKGSWSLLKDRGIRLGAPFLAMTFFWMPVAYYAPWSLQFPGGSLFRFLIVDARAGFLSGPGWFLWMLLLFDGVMAGFYAAGRGWPRLTCWLRLRGKSPELALPAMLLAGMVLYVPLALRYSGVWVALLSPPFMLQPSRALFYAAWFTAGMFAGSAGLQQGLLAPSGSLACNWPLWSLVGFAAGNALWFGSRPSAWTTLAPLHRAILVDLLWVLADVGIGFGLLALFRARAFRRRAWADSFARHAYTIYVLHYVFALWIERWLLRAGWPALAKFLLAFAGTLVISWVAAIAWLGLWHRRPRFLRLAT